MTPGDGAQPAASDPTNPSPRRRARRNKSSRTCFCLPFSMSSASTSDDEPSCPAPTGHPSMAAATPAPPATGQLYTTPSRAPTPPSSATPTVRTRVLIISDTHGVEPQAAQPDGAAAPRSAFHEPLPEADVVIHCGDLTKRSTIEEYRATAALLRSARAPVKIAIAGNHDVSLHESYYRERVASLSKDDRPDFGWLFKQLATHHDAAAAVSADAGLTYLEEGAHSLVLANGARLRLYTSPWTPSYGGWAFQYLGPRAFDIPSDVDLAVTHGPPRDVLDFAANGDHAGCEHLFRAVERARPRVHCYGHIHEAWGAYYGHWAGEHDPSARPESSGSEDAESVSSVGSAPTQVVPPRTMRYFDGEKSRVLEDVSTIRVGSGEEEEEARGKKERWDEYAAAGCRTVDVTGEGETPVEKGRQTMFLNAAILDRRYKVGQFPFLVEIDLPKA